MNELVIVNDKDVPTTTSLMVAEAFGKRHDHVMRNIKVIIGILKSNKLPLPNFGESDYTNDRGKTYPCYEMDRNAYSKLVGSFIGEKATVFRKKYADAFDRMEKALKRPIDYLGRPYLVSEGYSFSPIETNKSIWYE